MTDVRGDGGVGATGCRHTEIHSLFTGSPDGAFGVWTRSAGFGPCPGAAAAAAATAAGIGLPLGHAAAGAGAALSAADAVGCAAVLRGRW